MLSSRGRQQYKLGEMVSLMSVDSQRLCGVAPYLHQFWSAPLQLCVSVTLLYAIVGPSVFAGMMLMVLLIPVNTWIATKQTEIQRQIMKVNLGPKPQTPNQAKYERSKSSTVTPDHYTLNRVRDERSSPSTVTSNPYTIKQVKDERSNCMDEMLQGIRIIKYFAWEQSFITKVGNFTRLAFA